MNLPITLHTSRRRLLTLVLALVLGLSATYGAPLLDSLTGTAFTPQAHACQRPGGGC
jgi:hypothetical protein